jgi:riboflavin synthase
LEIAHSAALGERLVGDGVGASLAVNGVCLTLVEITPERSAVELSPETLARTTLGDLEEGDAVNLEPALRAGDALGGHWVQGHVDTTIEVLEIRVLPEQTSEQTSGESADGEHWEVAFALPAEFAPLVAEKGSVTLDGVSLTVSRLLEDRFEVALIPHTLAVTTLDALKVGRRVNLEVDVLARYVSRYVRRVMAL